ncbi:hypothetical protein BS78_06G121500 [Paspalum vaginatum]|nr:hypothetical protein BS78_06G121500 [Paspalum vaginatum]
MQIFCPTLRLLRHPNFAASVAPMHRLSSALQFPLCFIASATTSWWLPALSRRVFPFMMSPIPPVNRVFRLPRGPRNMATISRAEGDEYGKLYRRVPITSANVISLPLDNIEKSGAILDVIAGDDTTDKDACWNTMEGIYIEHDACGQTAKHTGSDGDERRATEDHGEIVVSDDQEYTVDNILPESRHRDGSIYKGMDAWWKQAYHIADRNETRLQAMALSDPSDCIIHDGTCMKHQPRCMLQIFSLELTKIPVDVGFVELYGYIVVRDELDPLLNFIVNVSRDEPIIVEQGSLINMAGPKRGIDIMDQALIEYDMRIKAGEQEKDDLQLIDGASIIGPAIVCNWLCTFQIASDSGAVGLTLSYLEDAVEATVEVLISEVQSSFNLSLGCLTSGLNKEIRLFDGAIAESCFLKRSVVAVVMDSLIDLNFKVGSPLLSSDQHCCSLKSKDHGHDTQEIKTNFALISVKVTWSTLLDLN